MSIYKAIDTELAKACRVVSISAVTYRPKGEWFQWTKTVTHRSFSSTGISGSSRWERMINYCDGLFMVHKPNVVLNTIPEFQLELYHPDFVERVQGFVRSIRFSISDYQDSTFTHDFGSFQDK